MTRTRLGARAAQLAHAAGLALALDRHLRRADAE